MRNRPLFLTLALAGVSVAACNRQTAQAPAPPATGAPIASLPLAEGAPPPAALAPAAAALPPAKPVKVVRAPARTQYRYIDRAYAMGEAFADSPPDYTVDYDGVRPDVWRSEDGAYRVVEPTPDGDRTYYYNPGSDEPFLVRDPQYAYGYDQGDLAVVYGPGGEVGGYDPYAADRAARYLLRARALYDAAIHQQRQAAYAQAWRARRANVLAEQQAWAAEQQRDAGWRAWSDEHRRPDQANWNRERAMRQAYAAQTAAQVSAAAAVAQHQANQRRQVQEQARAAQQAQLQAQAVRQAQVQQQAQAAQQAQAQQQAQAVRAAQQAQAQAARRAQAQAAHQAQAQQQVQAAHAAQQAQAQAARRAQAQAAHQAQAQQQAQAAHAAQQAQAEAARRAQAQAAHQAQAQQQAQAAHAAQQAQAQAARRAQAQAAQQQAQAAAHQAQAHGHPGPHPGKPGDHKEQNGG